MTRTLSVFNFLKRVGFAILLLGGSVTALAQPYELRFLYDEISDEPWRSGGDIAALGDQDGDGFDDILTSEWDGVGVSNHLKIVYGSENEPYRTLDFGYTALDTSTIQYFWHQWSPYTSCGDYNGDGHMDIMVELLRHPDQQTRMYLYLGGPVLFDSLWDWAASDFTGRRSTGSFGDYNEDGFEDYIFTNRPTGSQREFIFRQSCWLTQNDAPTWTFGFGETLDEPYPVDERSYGDLNGDGHPDFTFHGYVDLFFNDSIATDSVYQDFWFGGTDADSVPEISLRMDGHQNCIAAYEILSDVNGDGYDDLLAHTLRPGLHGPVPNDNRIYYGGDPLDLEGVDAFWDTPLNRFAAEQGQKLGDINGDGYQDMGFNQGGGALYIFLGGNPLSQQAAYIRESYEDPLIATSLSPAGDFNGDGLDDWMYVSLEDYEFPPPPEGLRVRLSIVAGDRNFGLSAHDRPELPQSITLLPCYPNPFNSSVTLPLEVSAYLQNVEIEIVNTLGQTVYRFEQEQFTPGLHHLTWNAIDSHGSLVSSGLYFVKITSPQSIQSRKILYIR